MESSSSRNLELFRYGPVVLAGVCAGYFLYQHFSNRTPDARRDTFPHLEARKSSEYLDEASGVMRMLLDPECEDDEKDAKAVYVTLKGCRMEIHEANEEVPRRELFDEQPPELTFKSRTTYNIHQSEVRLLPHDWAQRNKWLMKYPIIIILKPTSLIEELHFDYENEAPRQTNPAEIFLYARSNRDKEAWTKWLMAAVQNEKFPISEEDPILSIRSGKPLVEPQPVYIERRTKSIWLNRLVERTLNDKKIKDKIVAMISKKIEAMLAGMRRQSQFDSVLQTSVEEVDLSSMSIPRVTGVAPRYENEYGLWEEMCVKFDGALRISVKVKLNVQEIEDVESDSFWFDRLQNLAQYSLVKRMLENTTVFVVFSLDSLKGVMALNIPHSPTETAWIGFKPNTKISVSGKVYLGTWPVPFFQRIISSMTSYMTQNFYKHLVVPNMVQFKLPPYFNY